MRRRPAPDSSHATGIIEIKLDGRTVKTIDLQALGRKEYESPQQIVWRSAQLNPNVKHNLKVRVVNSTALTYRSRSSRAAAAASTSMLSTSPSALDDGDVVLTRQHALSFDWRNDFLSSELNALHTECPIMLRRNKPALQASIALRHPDIPRERTTATLFATSRRRTQRVAPARARTRSSLCNAPDLGRREAKETQPAYFNEARGHSSRSYSSYTLARRL